MPMYIDELNTIEEQIMNILNGNSDLAYSSKEISEKLDIAHSTARKHLKEMFDKGLIDRGKQKNFNKTYFYYVRVE